MMTQWRWWRYNNINIIIADSAYGDNGIKPGNANDNAGSHSKDSL